MLRRNSLSLVTKGAKHQLHQQSQRIESIIAQSRLTMSPQRLPTKFKLPSTCRQDPNSEVVFPRRRRYSLNCQQELHSQEYKNVLRSHEKFNTKLLKMKEVIAVEQQAKSPSKLSRINPLGSKPTTQQSEQQSPSPVPQFDRQVTDVLQGIKKNLMIFQKLFFSSRNKPELVAKMAGWDDDFKPLFFADSQVRNVSIEQIKAALGMERRTARSRNFYNKLKLLLGELRRHNTERENLLATIQRQKITEELSEINNIERLFYSSCKDEDREQYERMVGHTRSRVLEMKSQIKDKNGLIRTIEDQTGGLACIDNFFRKQEDNLVLLQSLVTKKAGNADKH